MSGVSSQLTSFSDISAVCSRASEALATSVVCFCHLTHYLNIASTTLTYNLQRQPTLIILIMMPKLLQDELSS